MKSINYILLTCAVATLAFACTKETIENTPDEIIPVEEVTATSDAIPQTITGLISNEAVKTSYDADGKFSWLNSDQVRLIVCEDLSTYSRQGIYTYKIKDGGLSSDGKTAVFTSNSTAGDLTAFVDGTWKSTGIAIYPTSVLDRFNTPESHSYGTPWFTLARYGVVSGLASDIMLAGQALSDNSNFKFSTAMAVLKVTVKNIPANTATIKLCTSDKSNYPVDGDFALSKGTDGIVVMSFLPNYVDDFKGYQAVDLSSEGEISSRDFYFNIPANTYPAGTLSIRLEDANGGKIMVRTVNKALSLERNDCLAIPALTYSHEIAFQAGCLASNPMITWAIDSHRVRFCVSQNSTINLTEFDSGYTFANDNTSGNYTGSYALSSFSKQKPSVSGQYYMHYLLQSDRGGLPTSLTASNVIAYGTIPFYYLSNEDATTYAKQYHFTKTDGTNFWHPGTGSNYTTTMTLAVSNDVTRGNLMISELYGKSGDKLKVYGTLTASDATSMTFTYNGDGNDKYFFTQNGNYFHIAQGSSHDANVSGDIVFSIADGPVLTCENYLMMKYTSNYSSWNEFISGVGLVFN